MAHYSLNLGRYNCKNILAIFTSQLAIKTVLGQQKLPVEIILWVKPRCINREEVTQMGLLSGGILGPIF